MEVMFSQHSGTVVDAIWAVCCLPTVLRVASQVEVVLDASSSDVGPYTSPEESWKSMRWRYYELLWLIRHLGPFLSQNPADASLASLMNFF